MRIAYGTIGLIALLAISVRAATESFDPDWRFVKGDQHGAEEIKFDDSSWQKVDVPHDWSIEGPFDQNAPTRGSGGFLPAGVGWYRKHFKLPDDANGKKVFIDFDGVMANSDVWINGQLLGHRPYGYISFRYDLTPHLKPENVIAVRCDNSQQPASRWYAGAGIYRHVNVVVAYPVHFVHWSNFVTTPQVSADRATLHVSSVVLNESDRPREIFVGAKIFDAGGVMADSTSSKPQTIEPGKSLPYEMDFKIDRPKLWDLDSPHLYRTTISVVEKRDVDAVLDAEDIKVGIRNAEFKADTGFWLNGKNFKLKGVCLHHDGGAFGAAVPDDVWERRLKALKELGVNSVRTAHNPPSTDFLDLCDRLGLVVMDETFDCWTVAKNPYDYHLYFRDWFKTDARDMVLRDRNHPSIVVYSAGNEIHDTPKPDVAIPILTDLVKVMHEADPSRPVTQALFRPNVSHDYENGLADLLDVVGTNYRDAEVIAAHDAKPTRKILGTENGHDRKVWLALRDSVPYAGQYLWSGIDYLGEARRWPTNTAGSGLLDRTGTPKARAWERQSWWSDKPMVKIARRIAPEQRAPTDPGFVPLGRQQFQFCDWTPKNLDAHQENVEIYSNCEQVELILNDKSLGSKSKPGDDSPRAWQVDFVPGTIKAIAKNGDKVVATDELRTAGKPAKIVLSADRETLSPGWDHVAFIRATVVDDKGVLVPGADVPIAFKITGPGKVAAVDNSDNASSEPFQAEKRNAFMGWCLAMVKATGDSGSVTVEASSPDLAGDSARLQVAK